MSNKEQLVNEYIRFLELEKKYSSNTCNSYRSDIIEFLNDTKKSITSITKNDIDKYILSSVKKYKDTSINRKIASIKGFYKYLNTYKEYTDIYSDISSLKKTSKLPNYLTTEEVNKLLSFNLVSKYDYRNKAMLELLYCSGLRASELIKLDTTSLDFDNRIVNVYGKGKKERIVPLSDIAIKYLKIYIYEYRSKLFVKGKKRTDSLFLNNHGERITRQGLNLLLNKIADNLDINKEITPHVLRHSFATHLIENGADIRSVQELLGHENVVTTEIYTHIANKYINDSYKDYFNRSTKGDNNV